MIKHQFVSAKDDGADESVVRPSDWNADHVDDTPQVSEAERIAGTETELRRFAPADIKSMAETHGGAPDYILLQDQKAQNVGGGNFVSGGDRTRDLNTKVIDTGNHCSLLDNQFTLAAGTYDMLATAPGILCGGHQAWLYNVTDAQDEPNCRGTTQGTSTSAGLSTPSIIRSRFTIAAQKTFEIRHRCTSTYANGFGLAANHGTEIYTVVELWKINEGAGESISTLFDAHTILAATLDDTPAALTIAEATIVGRQTGGNIEAIAQVSAGEKTAGTETALRAFAPADVKNMAEIHGGGGALVLLEQYTASNSASLDFTTCISATYDEYLVEFVNVTPATNGAALWLRVSTDGGLTYDAGAGRYSWGGLFVVNNASAGQGSDADTKMMACGSISSTLATGGVCGSLRLLSPGSTSINKQIVSDVGCSSTTNAGKMSTQRYQGAYLQTTAVNAFQFLMSTGNIATGTIRVYGIVKS